VDAFLAEAAESEGKRKPTPPAELYTLLSTYDYPGNVRELRMMVFDAVVRHTGGVLSLESFRKTVGRGRRRPRTRRPRAAARPEPLLSSAVCRGSHPQGGRGSTRRRGPHEGTGQQGIAASLLGITARR